VRSRCHDLRERFKIAHATLQLEPEGGDDCERTVDGAL